MHYEFNLCSGPVARACTVRCWRQRLPPLAWVLSCPFRFRFRFRFPLS